MESPPIIKPLTFAAPIGGSEHLGPVIHTWRFSAARWRLIQAAITWGGCILFLALVVRGTTGNFDFVKRNLGFMAIVSSVLAALPLLGLIFTGAQKIELELRPNGLAFTGSHRGVIPWADITSLKREPGGTSPDGRTRYLWRCNVTTPAWHFHVGPGHLSGWRLYEILAEQTRPLAWERLRAALAAGQEFSLGALIVGPEGIRVGRSRIGWRDIATIDIEGRYIVVTGKSELMDGTLRVLRHQVDFETLIEPLESATFSYRFGTATEFALPALPPALPPVAKPERLPTAHVVQSAGAGRAS